MNFRHKHGVQEPGFQIAPMIDVIFLLLCFFIASQIFSQWETEIDIKLPTAQTGEMPKRFPGEIIINILKDGDIVVNRRSLDKESLAVLLDRITEVSPGQPVLVRADKATHYENVIDVLDLCRQSDISNVSFATSASEE
ncbi:ExbD/TolR family protein [Verrucomicrobiota bacterium]